MQGACCHLWPKKICVCNEKTKYCSLSIYLPFILYYIQTPHSFFKVKICVFKLRKDVH